MSCIAPPRAWHSQHATEAENHTKAIQSVDPCFSGGTVASGTCHTLGVTTILSDRLSMVVQVEYLRSLLRRLRLTTFLSADRLGGAGHIVLRHRLPRTCRVA